jgi:hypothetical protein
MSCRFDEPHRLAKMPATIMDIFVLQICASPRCPHEGTIRREVNWWDPGPSLQAMKDINGTSSSSMYRFSPRYAQGELTKPSCLSRGVHHTSIVGRQPPRG